MEYVVKGYLVLLAGSAVVILGLRMLRVSQIRRDVSLSRDRTLLIRETFHILVGVILFTLFIKRLIGIVTTLAISALLLIAFEYAVVAIRRRSNVRSDVKPQRH